MSDKIIEHFTHADIDGTGHISSEILIRVLLSLCPDLQRDVLSCFLSTLGFSETGLIPYRSFVLCLFEESFYKKQRGSEQQSQQVLQQSARELCGEIFVHGCGDCDQLGLGSMRRERRKPARLHALAGVRIVSIACGGLHSICTSADGQLYSWGCGDDGALGRPTREDDCEPRLVQLPTGVRGRIVACGDSHSCMVDLQGYVWAWGCYKDGSGHIGSLSRHESTDAKWLPRRASTINEIVGISSGSNHTIAVTSSGKAFAWGSNQSGQLGLRSRRGCEFCVEELNSLNADMTFLDREGGDVIAWRQDQPGTMYHVMSVSLGIDSAIDAQGLNASEIQRYALNGASVKTLANRKVPLEEKISLMLPQTIETSITISNVFASSEGTFVTAMDSHCYGCGLNSSGQVGIGYLSPVVFDLQRMTGLRGASWIGGGMHMSAALVAGRVFTWGRAEECGHGLEVGSSPVLIPRMVSSLPPIRALRCGMSHVLACCNHGQVYSWGCGVSHQLGNCPRNYRDNWESDREPNDELFPYMISSRRLDGRTVILADGGAQHTVELVRADDYSLVLEQKDLSSDSEACVADDCKVRIGCSIEQALATSRNGACNDEDEGAIVVTTSEQFWRVQVEAVYRRRNPHKMANVPELLKKYEGQEAILYTKVCMRYDLNPKKFYADPEAWVDEEHDIKPEIEPFVDRHSPPPPSKEPVVDAHKSPPWSMDISPDVDSEIASPTFDATQIFQFGSDANHRFQIQPFEKTLFQFGRVDKVDGTPDSKALDSYASSDEDDKPIDRRRAKRKKPRVLHNTTFVKSKRK